MPQSLRHAFVLLALSSCSSTTGKLKTRFANEHGCPREQVTVEERGGTEYRASGCGDSAEYVCATFAGMGDDARNCEERGSQKRVPTDASQYPKPADRLPVTK